MSPSISLLSATSDLAYPHRIESAPWFAAGEQLDGASVCNRVIELASEREWPARPYAVYVHVPFCKSICSFCALYAQALGGTPERRLDEYLSGVLRSLELNPWQGSNRAPTTVHFGGGTPLVLGARRFERLKQGLIDAFGDSPACEWAVETTTSSLDSATIDLLEALCVRRIHLGIQTLDDATRSRLGRQESGQKAIARVMELEARGFHTSVDLILGLDGVSEVMIEEDLSRLYQAGVRMFSICELRERSRAQTLAKQHDAARARRHYAAWQTIWRFMERVGLIPIHCGQFARNHADNLYFTHPARGEDCVAIGPYAHGSVGHVTYGNLLLPEYYQSIRAGELPIAFGADYSAAEQAVCALERKLLAHGVLCGELSDLLNTFPNCFEDVLETWIAKGLLQAATGEQGFTVTMSGSWFVGNMIADVRALAEYVSPTDTQMTAVT
ncbi:MAG: radical SAM protein [Candidatus Hydrogenedentes bacterium]|nr:radical SAM protein [Candidatus Hydrogenedentota bacterium]